MVITPTEDENLKEMAVKIRNEVRVFKKANTHYDLTVRTGSDAVIVYRSTDLTD